MDQGRKATNNAHKGVTLVRSSTGGKKDGIKWRDPASGKWVKATFKSATKTQLLDIAIAKSKDLKKLKLAIQTQTYIPANRDLLDDWKADPTKAASTLQNREIQSRYLYRLAKDHIRGPIDQCTRRHMQALRVMVADNPKLRATTKNKILIGLQAFLANNMKHLPNITVAMVKDELQKVTVKEESRTGRHLTPANLHSIFSTAAEMDPRNATFLALSFLLGTRAGELSKSKPEHFIDGADQAPHLVVKADKAPYKARNVNLEPYAPAALNLLRALQPLDSGYYFERSNQPQAYRPQKNFLERVVRTTGIPTTLKDFRSTCGAYLAKVEGNAFAVAARQGHGIEVAHKHYMGNVNMLRLDTNTPTLEAMAGLETLFEKLAQLL
jgi:integrase